MILLFMSITLFVNAIAQLRVSPNNRYLQNNDSTPFLWLGDTAWELFHRLDREEATHYLETRKEQGFTVIQAVVLAENDGLRVPNAYGQQPFDNLDPNRPNELYFQHVDFIINKANELGLVMGLLPTWGDKVFSEHPGAGPVVFDKDNARDFGLFLGKRYKDKDLVWILGGDRNIANEEVLEIWKSMASGLEKGDEGMHLISFHPRGGSSSSYYLHNEPWLDFNMYQSGHAKRYNHVYHWAEKDILRSPRKPVVEGEPAYESIAIRFWEYLDWDNPLRVPKEVLNEEGLILDSSYFSSGFFNDHDIRVHAYWNFLSGACGYTYGNNAVWQMYKKGGYIAIPAIEDWRSSLQHPGANQIKHIRTIFEEFSIAEMIPDQSLIYGQNPDGENHIRAARDINNKWALIYLSKGQKVSVVMNKFENSVSAYEFNPTTGKRRLKGVYPGNGIVTIDSTTREKNPDRLLILVSK